MKTTNVLFLLGRDSETEVFAYFPDNFYNKQLHPDLRDCYSHIGQHSACHVDYAAGCKEANYNQYQDLLKELVSIGYENLIIKNSQLIECWRNPTKGEIKFGEGAVHWRSFTLEQIGLNDNGEIKNWFISPDDGLRYYRR